MDFFSFLANNNTRIISVLVACATGGCIGLLNFFFLGFSLSAALFTGIGLGLVVGFICCRNIAKDTKVDLSSKPMHRAKVFSAFTALD